MAASEHAGFVDRFFDSGFMLSVVITLVTFMLFLVKQKRGNNPPCYSGWIPWLGCAIEFGKAPLYFIEESRRKVKVGGAPVTQSVIS